MSRTSTSGLPVVLRRLLDRYRRRRLLVNAQRGLLLALAVLVDCVGLAVVADRLLRLKPALRAVALGLIGAAFVFCLVWWVVWPAVRRVRDRHAAMRLGRHFPQMQEDLVSAVELAADEGNQQGVSRSLIVSVLGRIARRAARLDYRAAVPLRPLLVAAAVFLVVLAALHTAYVVRPEAIRNALHRLLRPNRSVPFFSYTRLTVLPGNQVIRTGDTAEVVADLAGRRPEAVRLEARIGSEALRVTLPCTDGRARWQSGPLFQDLRHRVLAGDAVSDWYRVRVVPPPALRNKSAVLYDPEYAGGRDRTIESIQGPFEIVRGTALVLGAEPVVRGRDPGFQCEGELAIGEERLRLRPDASGVLRSPRFVPEKTAEYAIELKDAFGLRSRAPESVFVKVAPDRVPRVSITEPGRDVMILRGEEIEVAAEAEDEFGLRRLALWYREVEGGGADARPGPWQRRTLEKGGVEVRRLSAKTGLEVGALGLEPGDLLEYKAEAADYAAEAFSRRGYSRVYRITVISAMEHLERAMARLQDLRLELLRRAAAQKVEAAKAGELAEAAREGPVNEAAAQARQRELAQARATELLARRFESLIPEVARNPSPPTGLLSGLERLGREVRSVATDPMTSAADSLGEAADAEPGDQAPALRQAQRSGAEAARRLESLASMAERLQRSSVLEKLAAEAERLAAWQRELKEAAVSLAMRTASRTRAELAEELSGALDRLTAAERSVKTGVEVLTSGIEKAATSLAFSKPADAVTAEEAGAKLESDKVADKAEALARKMEQNVLFSPLPLHEEVAVSLEDVARTLRRATESEQMEAIAREIEEFIRRQKQINAQIELAGGKADRSLRPAALGGRQSNLARDVSEHAGALEWLAREIEHFESATAGRLALASVEMRAGAHDLYRSAWPGGLEHGRRALALLEAARDRFGAESGPMASAFQVRQSLRAALLLQRILLGQKRVNKGTAAADQRRGTDADGAARMATGLAEEQSALRLEARRLERMLARARGGAALVGKAGQKMDLSRIALTACDTGRDTRVVQRQIVAILEQLLGEQRGRMGGMGLAGIRALAMMQMLSQVGMRPGGFTGGANAPLLPAAVEEAEDEAWRRVRSRFEEHLGEGFEDQYPARFRELLNVYFDRLRREPPR